MKEVECMFCDGIGYELYVWKCDVYEGFGKL